jgi:divalent metal cation (Fe/Co/Zn/Cd) transporter
VWDAAASAVIGVLLLAVALVLAIENHSLLIGESAPRRTEQAIRAAVLGEPGVLGIQSLHTMHLGANRILIVLGIHFADDLSVPAVEGVVARLERRVADALGGMTDARLIVIEPAPLSGARPAKKFLPGKCYAR